VKVAAYWNLHKNIFSIQSREKENYGKVISHKDSVVIVLPKFVVRQAGREKVLKTKQKNVHAFVVGHMLLDNESFMFGAYDKPSLVYYNPHKYKQFVKADTKEEVLSADVVTLRMHNEKPVIEAYL
jgi:hypothetical protein